MRCRLLHQTGYILGKRRYQPYRLNTYRRSPKISHRSKIASFFLFHNSVTIHSDVDRFVETFFSVN